MEPTSLAEPPLFTALRGARNVLVAGAGGGFDVYAGLPLALALRAGGTQVHLANLSFTPLELLDLDAWLARDVAAVGPQTNGFEDYFPERTLARWLDAHGEPSTVYAFPKTGVQPLRAAYRELRDRLSLDAIVLAGRSALRAGWSRPGTAIPAFGIMRFDTADLQRMEQTGSLNDVITHEMDGRPRGRRALRTAARPGARRGIVRHGGRDGRVTAGNCRQSVRYSTGGGCHNARR